MIQIKKLMPIVVAIISAISANAVAQSAPAEITTQIVTRSSQNPNQAVTRLSKNLFRQENVQVPYTVQVPYETTETYIEQVPYTVEVPYTDYVTDYKQEYRCRNVTRYRNEQRCETRTDYRRECRNEQHCYLVPGEPQRCRDVEECGVNVAGVKICKTRRVCEGGTPQQQRCENRQKCHDVPYTRQECRNVQVPYTDQECGYEQVAYQRPITRYRNETRYREETRTRTVTRYRDETRCCKTETQTVFDRQLQFQVVLSFPQDAALAPHESESLRVTLTSATPGQVSVQTAQSLYGYRIASQVQSGEVINVQLALAPLFDQANAGSASLQNVQLTYSPLLAKFVVSFVDTVNHPKVLTTSEIEIRDLATDALIEQGIATSLANGKMGLVVQASIPSYQKLRAVVKTTRQGSVISAGQLSFVSSAIYDRRTLTSEDVQILSDSTRVQLTAPIQQGLNAMIKLTDLTENFAEVRTQYVLSLFEVVAGQLRAINTPQTVSREQAQAQNGEVTLARLLGSKASQILRPGRLIRAQVTVQRSVNVSHVGQPTAFSVATDIHIQ